jgi:hypothetical protein
LKFFNQDSPKVKGYSPEVISLIQEVNKNKRHLFEEFKGTVECNKKKGNPASSCINKIWCEKENELLQNAMKKTDKVGVPMFDGFMCENKLDPSIFNTDGFTWSEKENVSDIFIEGDSKKKSLVHVIHEYCVGKCEELNFLMAETTVKERKGYMQVADMLNLETGQPLSKKLFLEKIIFKQPGCSDELTEDIKKFCYNPRYQKELIESLGNSVNYAQLHYDKNVISFNNGYLNLSEIKFYEYEDGVDYQPSKSHFDSDFNVSYLSQEWDDIDAGDWDHVLKYQFGHDPDLMLCLNGALGRLHLPILKHDSFNFMLLLKGASGSGKVRF